MGILCPWSRGSKSNESNLKFYTSSIIVFSSTESVPRSFPSFLILMCLSILSKLLLAALSRPLFRLLPFKVVGSSLNPPELWLLILSMASTISSIGFIVDRFGGEISLENIRRSGFFAIVKLFSYLFIFRILFLEFDLLRFRLLDFD